MRLQVKSAQIEVHTSFSLLEVGLGIAISSNRKPPPLTAPQASPPAAALPV